MGRPKHSKGHYGGDYRPWGAHKSGKRSGSPVGCCLVLLVGVIGTGTGLLVLLDVARQVLT